MKNALIFIMLAIIAISPATRAQVTPAIAIDPSPDDSHFKDWIALAEYMRSQGLEPTGIRWEVIDQMCLGLKKTGNEVPFNRCKFQHAQNSVLHSSDRAGCVAQAIGAYPDYLLVPDPVEIDEDDHSNTTHTYRSGRTTTTIYNNGYRRPAISHRQLESMRNGAVVACMGALGWNNADNWALGRRPAAVIVPVPAY